MSTNSNIIIFDKTEMNAKIAYCHYDGYYEFVGSILHHEYNNYDLADKLVSGGNMPVVKINHDEIDYYKNESYRTYDFPKSEKADLVSCIKNDDFDSLEKALINFYNANYTRYDGIEFVYIFINDAWYSIYKNRIKKLGEINEIIDPKINYKSYDV